MSGTDLRYAATRYRGSLLKQALAEVTNPREVKRDDAKTCLFSAQDFRLEGENLRWPGMLLCVRFDSLRFDSARSRLPLSCDESLTRAVLLPGGEPRGPL
eukprot:3099279-Rhodomonas_salina.3